MQRFSGQLYKPRQIHAPTSTLPPSPFPPRPPPPPHQDRERSIPSPPESSHDFSCSAAPAPTQATSAPLPASKLASLSWNLLQTRGEHSFPVSCLRSPRLYQSPGRRASCRLFFCLQGSPAGPGAISGPLPSRRSLKEMGGGGPGEGPSQWQRGHGSQRRWSWPL